MMVEQGGVFGVGDIVPAFDGVGHFEAKDQPVFVIDVCPVWVMLEFVDEVL